MTAMLKWTMSLGLSSSCFEADFCVATQKCEKWFLPLRIALTAELWALSCPAGRMQFKGWTLSCREAQATLWRTLSVLFCSGTNQWDAHFCSFVRVVCFWEPSPGAAGLHLVIINTGLSTTSIIHKAQEHVDSAASWERRMQSPGGRLHLLLRCTERERLKWSKRRQHRSSCGAKSCSF